MKLTQKATSGKQKLNILSYNPGLNTEFHKSCSNVLKTILDFTKLCIFPDFLPQPSNFFYTDISAISVTFRNSGEVLPRMRGPPTKHQTGVEGSYDREE